LAKANVLPYDQTNGARVESALREKFREGFERRILHTRNLMMVIDIEGR
jgi:hypothetical protein